MNLAVGSIIKRIFPNTTLSYVKKFKSGVINKTYDVRVKNRSFVLRIYPKDFWKVRKEQYLYYLIMKKTDVPVPKVIRTGKNYVLMQRIEGKELSINNKHLIKRSGELLAKLHSIKFPYYGWIIKDEIKPKFSSWFEFIKHDLNQKLRKLPAGHKLLKNEIKNVIYRSKPLLNVKSRPCLLHKDYHSSHIIVNKNKIKGIIDLEWAMAGHNEMDLAKSCMWMFERKPALEKIFLKAYQTYGKITKDYKERNSVYRLLVLLSALSLSYECRNRRWCKYNLKKLKGELDEYNKTN